MRGGQSDALLLGDAKGGPFVDTPVTALGDIGPYVGVVNGVLESSSRGNDPARCSHAA